MREARVLGRVRAVLGQRFRWRLRFRKEVTERGRGVGCRLLQVPRGWRGLVVGEAVWDRRRMVLERGIRQGLRPLINQWGWVRGIAV